MIHLRQAQACHDSWLCFYLLYIWYWVKTAWFGKRSVRRQLKHAAYLLNPFEMEAYARMNDLGYLKRCEGGAQEWRKYAKMSLKERLGKVKRATDFLRPDGSKRQSRVHGFTQINKTKRYE